MTRPSLLLLPPLGLPTHPFPALPQLTAWLRSRGRQVTPLDLNLEFCRWLVEPRRLRELISLGREALAVLEGRPALSGLEAARATTLRSALQTVDSLGPRFWTALDPTDPSGRGLRLQALSAALEVAFSTTDAERVHATPLGCQYFGSFDPYSSASIVGELESGASLFDDFYGDFLPGVLREEWLFAGISIPFASQCGPGLRMARAVKTLRPGLPVVIGGSYVGMHLSATEEPALFRYVDVMVSGSGERPLEQVCAELESPRPDLSRVAGATFLREGTVVRTPPGPPPPLAEIPLPDDSLDRSRYFGGADDSFLQVKLSQGCGWRRCVFCNLAGCGLFPREIPDEERTFEKVRSLVGRGARMISFGDDEADPAMLERFARRVVDAGLRFRWTVNARLDPRMSLEWALLLRQAGCRTLAVGLEHLDDALLRWMRKGIDSVLVDRSLENLAWGGLPVLAYMMVGLPGETEDLARDTLRGVLQRMDEGLLSNVIYSAFTLSPGSPVHGDPGSHGISSLRPPPGADLNPPVQDFDQPGMSRRRAFELAEEFNGEIRGRRTRGRMPLPRAAEGPGKDRFRSEEVAAP